MSEASDYAEAAAQHRQKLLRRIQGLERREEAQERRMVVFTGLVERMGRNIAAMEARRGYVLRYPYTLIGQREYDAAQHEEEGEPETRESTGAHGYGGPGL